MRITAILLGLLGAERIVYANVFSLLPGMGTTTPAVTLAFGSVVLIAAVGLFLGFGWARWPGVAGATLVGLQGLAYAAWNLGQNVDPAVGVVLGLIEPLLALVVIDRLVRHWPAGVTWTGRLA